MFSLDNTMRYWLYNKPVNMRMGFNGLSGIVNNHMGMDIRSGFGSTHELNYSTSAKCYSIILSDEKSVLHLRLRNRCFGNDYFGTKLKVYEIF